MASTERAPELSDQAVMLAFQLVEYLHISNANVWELVSEEQKNTINFILKNFKNPQGDPPPKEEQGRSSRSREPAA